VPPDVAWSTARPGTKWSTLLVVGSIGIRTTGVQAMPSVDVLITRSFDAHPGRNRQSDQTTYTFPAASVSAECREPRVRRSPATRCSVTVATLRASVHVAPPFTDRNAMIAVPKAFEAGTMTVPSGCATGMPPSPVGLPSGEAFGLQVTPPSVEVLMRSLSPWLKSSQVV
jgi:hypothetical protein